MSDESTQFGKPTDKERRLIAALVAKASDLTLPSGWLEMLEVQSLADGGMGSLRLLFPVLSAAPKAFGKQASEFVFEDVDGVKVIASLNVDSSGLPMELDLWKTDFSPVLCIPVDLIGKSGTSRIIVGEDRGGRGKTGCESGSFRTSESPELHS